MRKPVNYSSYIKSAAWRDRHRSWLKKAGYRCMMFPWMQVGKPNRRTQYQPYECHHATYRNLGDEKFWWDVLVLSPQAHWVIHTLLGGAEQVSQQRSPYPNLPQRIAHTYCKLPSALKLAGFVLPLLLPLLGYKSRRSSRS